MTTVTQVNQALQLHAHTPRSGSWSSFPALSKWSVVLVMLLSVCVAQSETGRILPTLVSSQPEEGMRDVSPDSSIKLSFSDALTSEQLKGLSATLVGPSGTMSGVVEATNGNKSVKVRPSKPLLPASTYTLLLSIKPTVAPRSSEAVIAPKPLAVLGWRTRSLSAPVKGPAVAEPAGLADETFHPSSTQRKGDWLTHNRYPYTREMSAIAYEQQAVLDRLPPPARERLRARMQETGEYVPAEILGPTDTSLLQRSASNNGEHAPESHEKASLSGQTLRLNGRPLAHVKLSVGRHQTETNSRGEFTLTDLDAGDQVLVIDAHQAHRSKASLDPRTHETLASADIDNEPVDFGRYEYRVPLDPGLNRLPQTIWLTRIDHQHAVAIDSPTLRETVITHPDIPGLELNLPAGTVIRGADGQIVREVSITPIPVDQMPVSMPYQDVGVYYTIQPGGARIESVTGQPIAATLRYPNYSTQPAGAKRLLFDYDPQGRGWYVYGEGVVSPDGKRIEASEPFKIYQFALTSFATSGGVPRSDGPPPGGSGPGSSCDGDPVACTSGQFLEATNDLAVKDVLPINVIHDYRTPNDGAQHAFGIGSTGSFNLYLYFENINYYKADAIQLVLSNGFGVRFLPVDPNNTTYASGAVYESLEPGQFFKARISTVDPQHEFVVTTKDGSRYGFSYSKSTLKWQEDRFGNRISLMRDTTGVSNHVNRVVSPNGRWVDFQYGVVNCTECVSRVTDHAGRYVQYDYDALGQLKTVTGPESTLTDYTWNDTTHQILTVKDARRNIKVTNEYYAGTGNAVLDGRVKKQTYADGTYKNFSYTFDAGNKITATEVTDQRGVIRHIEYDASRYVVRDIYAMGTSKESSWQFLRDPVTHLVTVETDPLRRQTKYEYDAFGNQISRTVLYGSSQATMWQTSYEPKYNQRLVDTDPLGRKTTRVYDDQGQLNEVSDALGHKTTYAWYPNGQLRSTTEWPGIPTAGTQLTTTFTYEYGDLVKVTDPKARITQFNVDALGRVIGVRDAANQLSTMVYDGQDRVTQRCDASGACANMVFDGNGNLTQFKLGTTQRDMTYDVMNRLQTEGRNAGQTPATEVTVAYTNTDVKQTRAEASGRVIETNYDALWRPATINVSQGGTLKRTLTYNWDAASRLTSLADSVSGSLSYTYDDRFDAIKTETGPTGTISYSYYANGLRQTASPSGGSTISYNFDAANRLQTLSQAAGTGSAQPASALSVGIAYDNANRRSRLTLANGITLDYGWDDASQLTSLTYKLSNGTTLGDLAYGYDSLGRRTSISGSFARANLPSAASLPTGADGRTASDQGVSLQYDSNGRLTQDTTYSYTWNELGQLTAMRNVSDNALRASYSYDAIGRRISKTIDGVVTKYLHDGANPIQLQDGSGTPKESLLAGGIDEWFARTTAGQSQTYLSDALGSIIRLTDPSGAKLVDYTYDPYGKTSSDSASSNVFQYAGRENDGLGLYFNRARYYKPRFGKFISQDPIGLAGGDNLYAYVGGNPISSKDPMGLAACPGGSWVEEAGDFGFSGQLGGYGSYQTLNLSCRSKPNLKCKAKQVCVGGGLGVGVGAGGTIGGNVNGADDSSSLGGWGGWGLAFTLGPVAGSIDGTGSGSTSVSVPTGIGAAGVRCYTYALKCSEGCP